MLLYDEQKGNSKGGTEKFYILFPALFAPPDSVTSRIVFHTRISTRPHTKEGVWIGCEMWVWPCSIHSQPYTY